MQIVNLLFKLTFLAFFCWKFAGSLLNVQLENLPKFYYVDDLLAIIAGVSSLLFFPVHHFLSILLDKFCFQNSTVKRKHNILKHFSTDTFQSTYVGQNRKVLRNALLTSNL